MTADNAGDKAAHEAQKLKGKAKEKTGKAIGNEQMQAEGKVDKTAGSLKKAADEVKDAAKRP
jgi:uncharacterized protein YjbJ (UPF0337 family)